MLLRLLVLLILSVLSLPAFAQTGETPFATAEATVNLPIPDGSGKLSHAINLPGSGILQDIRVALRIRHEGVVQLRVTLTSPRGTTVVLHDQTFSDENPFQPIYETFTPSDEPLSTFIGEEAQGNWTLEIEDLLSGLDGTLEAWGIRVRPVSLVQPPPATPVPVASNIGFDRVSAYPLDTEISNIVVLDYDFDGLQDVILLSEAQERVQVYRSSGTDVIAPPVEVEVTNPRLVRAADLNADGISDLVIGSPGNVAGTSILTVLTGNFSGGFNVHFSATLQTELQAMALTELTGDNNPDVVIGGTPLLLRGVSDGSFSPSEPFVILGRDFLASGDLSGNGVLDYLFKVSPGGTSSSRNPLVLFLQPESLFPFIERDGARVTLNGTQLQAFTAATYEPSAKEFVVLSVTNETEPVQLYTAVRGSNNSNVTVTETRLAANTLATPVKPFDLNGDGLDELLFIKPEGVYSFQKIIGGTGGQSTLLVLRSNAKHVSAGSFFSDGAVGLALVNGQNELEIMISNQGARPTPPPRSTPTPSATPFLFVTPTPVPPTNTPAVTPTPITPLDRSPDLNADGIVDELDLLILIQYWKQQVE